MWNFVPLCLLAGGLRGRSQAGHIRHEVLQIVRLHPDIRHGLMGRMKPHRHRHVRVFLSHVAFNWGGLLIKMKTAHSMSE